MTGSTSASRDSKMLRKESVPDSLRRQLMQAKSDGGFWLQALEERLNEQERRAAEATIEAHLRAEEAEGVARAVHLAQEGQMWLPRDVAADMDALLAS